MESGEGSPGKGEVDRRAPSPGAQETHRCHRYHMASVSGMEVG